MITRWGANIEKDKVLLEYPRPQMRRNSYINLNGMWQYAIVRGESLPDKIDGEILVPFSPECELSGVHRTVGPEDTLVRKELLTAGGLQYRPGTAALWRGGPDRHSIPKRYGGRFPRRGLYALFH